MQATNSLKLDFSLLDHEKFQSTFYNRGNIDSNLEIDSERASNLAPKTFLEEDNFLNFDAIEPRSMKENQSNLLKLDLSYNSKNKSAGIREKEEVNEFNETGNAAKTENNTNILNPIMHKNPETNNNKTNNLNGNENINGLYQTLKVLQKTSDKEAFVLPNSLKVRERFKSAMLKNQQDLQRLQSLEWKKYYKKINFNAMGLIIKNNIKMFINKMRRWGYLHKVNFLDPQDLALINDLTYFEEEKNNEDQPLYQKTLDFFFFSTKLFASKMKMVGEKIGLFHPYHNIKLLWDFLNALMIIFLLFYFPISLTFTINIFDDAFKASYLLIILIDMLVQMNTLYFKFGIEVKNRKKIIINYCKTRLFPDCISSLSIITDYLNYAPLQGLQILFIFKIYSLLSINDKLLNRFRVNHKLKSIKDLLFLFCKIVFIAHLLACAWVYIGEHGSNNLENNWLKVNSLEETEWYVKYMYGYYWALMTVMTVGYGDITPKNISETFFVLLTILFGCLVFAYSMNSIGLIIQEINIDQIKFK